MCYLIRSIWLEGTGILDALIPALANELFTAVEGIVDVTSSSKWWVADAWVELIVGYGQYADDESPFRIERYVLFALNALRTLLPRRGVPSKEKAKQEIKNIRVQERGGGEGGGGKRVRFLNSFKGLSQAAKLRLADVVRRDAEAASFPRSNAGE